MNRHLEIKLLKAIFLIILVPFSACTNKSTKAKGGPVLSSMGNSIESGGTEESVDDEALIIQSPCNTFKASLTKIAPTGNVIPLGSKVVFEVAAEGCSSFRLNRTDNSQSDFAQKTYYEKVYSQEGNQTETVQVIPLYNGNPIGAAKSISSASFTIGTNVDNTGLNCTLTANKSSIEVEVSPDAQGVFEIPYHFPTIEFNVEGNANAHVTELKSIGSELEIETGLPVTTYTAIRARFTSFGVQYIEATIKNASGETGKCNKFIAVRKVFVMPPPPPVCKLVAAAESAYNDEGMLLSLITTGGGPVTDANIAGTRVAPMGGTIVVRPQAAGEATIIASVIGPTGQAFCNVKFLVKSRKQKCLIGIGNTSAGKGTVYIGDEMPADAEARLRKSLKASGLGSDTLSQWQRYSVDRFKTVAMPTYTYQGYQYQLISNGQPGSMDCPVVYQNKSPLMIDFEGKGIELTLPSNGPLYDLTADGKKLHYSWPLRPKSLLFLALDTSRRGNMESIHNLFGNFTKGPDGIQPLEGNGFDALKKHDRNGDGLIDSRDSIFSSLRLWADENSNGKSEAVELFTLSDKKIKSIDLAYFGEPERIDVYGNEIRERSFVKTQDGKFLPIYDLWFVGYSE